LKVLKLMHERLPIAAAYRYIYIKRLLMRNITLTLISCLIYLFTTGQGVKEVIEAEKKFAAYAVEYSTKEAFFRYLDSNAVMFDKGEIIEAKKLAANLPGSTVKLLWKPAFAGISKSGDLGFTTGPWEIRLAVSDSSVASGQFATIWLKTAADEWKFLADIGASANQKMDEYKEVKFAAAGKAAMIDTGFAATLETRINEQYAKEGPDALVKAAAPNCWYIVENNRPLQGVTEIRKRAKVITPASIRFTPVKAAVATSGDLAYAYGYVHYYNKKENYLRVWQNTDHGWKMLLVLIK
jgi:ketosteroid isomerase-like protein